MFYTEIMNRMGNYLGGLLIVLAILGAAAYYFGSRASNALDYTPPAQQPPGKGVVGNARLDSDPYDITITYTDDGFSPRDITIDQGTRVRFVNNSSSTFWPASGVHPTHTLYPEKEGSDCLGSAFDACEDLQPGEFYDFTFYYIGNWSYHDHLHAYNTGTITVTAASSSASQ